MAQTPYNKAPIKLFLQADWGTLSTYVSTFQLKRPINFDQGAVVALRAQKRHFRLPKELKLATEIALSKQGLNTGPMMSFTHAMRTEGDVPEMELDAIVQITYAINETIPDPSGPITIQGKLLRGLLSIRLDKHLLTPTFWPHRTQPQRLILDSRSCWVEMDENKLKLKPVPIVEPAGGRQEGIQWEILDVSNYQAHLISSIRTIGHLPESQGMTSPAHDGLQLSVAPYGPAQGVLRVNEDSFQYVLQNAVIFTGLGGTTWVPTYTIVSSADGGQMSHFSFTDIPSDAERTEAPLPCLSWCHRDDDDDSFTLSLHSSDERTLALVGAQDDPKLLQGAYLWSYQELNSNWGWLRWPICKSEHTTLVPKQDPFEVGVSGSTPLQWHWRLGLDRAHKARPQDNGIELRLDSEGLWTFYANKLHFSMASPEIRLFSGITPLVDPDCPPALLDPQNDKDLVKSRLQFVLASTTSSAGLRIPLMKVNGESTMKTEISGSLADSVQLAGSVDWIGSPDPNHAWIFTESITGRNLLSGTTTAWDPHAGKCWVTIQQCVLKSSDNQLMILDGDLKATTNFQATVALLPWVEGSKPDENTDGNTKLEVFHRNLICEIDEARAARADRGLRPDQRDQLSHADRTRAVRDRYASLGSIGQTLRRDHFWPGLKLNDLNLTQQPLSLQPPSALPKVQIGGRTMQLRTDPSNPPTAIPNHPHDWLDYQVYLRSLVNDGKQPNPVADVANDGDQDLHRGLLMKDGFWLDQSGALWDPTPDILAGFHMQVVYQATPESDSESFSWRRYALLTGCISLADDATIGHSINLFLDSFLIDLQTNKPPTTTPGALQAGAWKLLGGSSEESPRFFGLPLSEVSIESISNQAVTLKVLLLSPSEATTTSAIEIEFSVGQVRQIKLTSSEVSYQFHSLAALPFPHGGLPAQLTCLTGKLSLQEDSYGQQELHLSPSQETSLGLALGVSWPCFVPVLKAHGGGWSNQSQPRTRTPFWMETFQHLGNQPKFSCHSLHLEERKTAGFEEEDFSQAGFLIWTTTQLQFHSLYEPENPQGFEIEDPSSFLAEVDLLISRRAFAMSSSLQSEGARQIFLIRDQQNNIRVWPKSAQPTSTTTGVICHELQQVQGSLLLPISTSNSQRHGLAIAVWDQNTLRILTFSVDSAETKHKDLVFDTIGRVFRIPNQENQLIVIDAKGIHLAKLELNAADPSITQQLLNGLAFKSIHQIIGIDRTAFLVVDDTSTPFVITPGSDSWTATMIPNSNKAILVPELDVQHDFVERSDPRLFLAKVQDSSCVVHHWSLPKPSVTAADVVPDPFATIEYSVSAGLSTPLGPWWFDWQVQPTHAELRVFSLDDWVEWDERGIRADVQMRVRTAHSPQDESEKVPFDLVCRISRGHTLAMTHQCGESFSPAWPRQAQGQYTAFAVPSHIPQSHWTRGFLVLWPELLHDNTSESIVMAGAWFRESWQPKILKMTATETDPEQNWPCLVEGTLHILEVDWWQSNEWKHDITITGFLQASGSNWSLQVHEQTWQAETPILGLLFLQQGADGHVQLPMSLIPKSPLQIAGDSPTIEIQSGLYSVNEVASLLGSVELTDMSLPNPAGEGEDSYDIQPVTLGTENQWCRLTPRDSGRLELMNVNPDDQLPFLNLEARSELPKQPVARPQLTHRRVFGARLRFGSNVEPFQPMITNAWNVIGHVYNCNVNGVSENPDNLTSISRFMINNEDFREFTPKNRKLLWNAQARSFYRNEENPDWNLINPGDHFTAWTPALNDVSGIKPAPKPVEFKPSKYIGALTAQAGGNLWMFQEPYWVSLSNGPDKVYRTENVLVVGRSENTADPAVRCLRSVTDVVGSSTDRGLDLNTLWSFLSESGVSGLVIQRLFQAAGPPVYRFSRSPFSLPAGDISMVPHSPQVQGDESNTTGALLPIVLQGQPRSTQTFLAQYAPSFETSCPALPIFSRDYRHVSVQLKSSELNLSGTTTCSSLLLQESVCYADQALNDPSEHTASSPLPRTSTFYPLALDLVYATDKPGAMLNHSLDLHQMRGDQMAHGLRTMFTMRDPRQVILPPGAQLRISQLPEVKVNSITLTFEEVLGSLPAPSKPVEKLITAPDPDQPDSFILDYEALLLFTVIGDELIPLKQDSPYLPLESNKSRCIYLVSKGKLSNPYVVSDVQNGREFDLDAIKLEDEQPIGTTDYWRATITMRDEKSFQLLWKMKISGENLVPSRVKFFAKDELDIRLIPALATPKLGIVTCKGQKQNLDLFASATGGNAVFNLINDPLCPVVEVSNQYRVSWHRQTAGIDTFHVVKYFSDGQTLCASWPVPPK